MSRSTHARHRAAVRPKTPLTDLAQSMSVSAGTARRTAVIAATSGLLVTFGATGAEAHVRTPPAPKPAHTHAVHTHAKPTHTHAKPAHTHAPRAQAQTRASRSAARTAPAAAQQANLSATRANIMAVAASYVGTPYRYGGTSPSGFDCSGFTAHVFAQVGVSLPRTSGAQAASAVRISRAEALPGDLVYLPGHVGIYAGDGMLYDSPRTGSTVSKRAMWTSDFAFYRVLNG